jgi:hypothetical protein
VHAWVKRAERAELGTGEGESKGAQKRWMGRKGEGQVFMANEKSSEARLCAPSLIRRLLNLGGQTARLILHR